MRITKAIHSVLSIAVVIVLIGAILPFKESVEKKGAKTYNLHYMKTAAECMN